MAVTMAAMMAPTALPFFLARWRNTRRAMGVAIAILIYVAAWAAIGAGVDRLTAQVMMPSSWLVDAIAVAVAALYTVTPWAGAARAACRDMCEREARSPRLRAAAAAGLTYAAGCVVCSAGVMVAVMVLGMANLLVIVAGAVVIFILKLSSWPAPASSVSG
ncbi:MAG TPA: DUF2182 domain-containing protein [Candidatus Dormibacteraeota bacterium]